MFWSIKESPPHGLRCDSFVVLISAATVDSLIGIVCIRLRAICTRVQPVVAHPAARTAPGVHVAIDAFLLRETHWRGSMVDRLHRLLHCRGCEGPARATGALIFYWSDVAHLSIVDRSCGVVADLEPSIIAILSSWIVLLIVFVLFTF